MSPSAPAPRLIIVVDSARAAWESLARADAAARLLVASLVGDDDARSGAARSVRPQIEPPAPPPEADSLLITYIERWDGAFPVEKRVVALAHPMVTHSPSLPLAAEVVPACVASHAAASSLPVAAMH